MTGAVVPTSDFRPSEMDLTEFEMVDAVARLSLGMQPLQDASLVSVHAGHTHCDFSLPPVLTS